QTEVYRFSLPVAILIPLGAVFLQAFLPIRMSFFSLFDLPLLVTIFFAVARRSQVSGMLTGALIGLLQDSLAHQPIGLYGISQTEVYRFSLPVAILIPLGAVFLQAFLPIRMSFFSLFDLPLLVTIFFAVARRSQVSGMLTGALIGLLQDSLAHQPIGLYGISK